MEPHLKRLSSSKINFTGTVSEVWFHDQQGYLARVKYCNGDSEDMELFQLETLLLSTIKEARSLESVKINSLSSYMKHGTDHLR